MFSLKIQYPSSLFSSCSSILYLPPITWQICSQNTSPIFNRENYVKYSLFCYGSVFGLPLINLLPPAINNQWGDGRWEGLKEGGDPDRRVWAMNGNLIRKLERVQAVHYPSTLEKTHTLRVRFSLTCLTRVNGSGPFRANRERSETCPCPRF